MGRDVGPILAALGAGTASAYSPYAARGINAGANVLGAFGENRYREAQGQRVQHALEKEADERRRQEKIRTETDRLIDENTNFGPPFNPPPGGVSAGLPLQQARLAKLLNAQNTTEALQLLEKQQLGQGRPQAQPLTALQGLKLGQGEKLQAETAEGFKYERDVPKPETRKLRFDVFTDPRGIRRQTVTDEGTGDVLKTNQLGRERVPSDVSVRSFTDDNGNFQVVGIGPGGGTAFQKNFGRTKGETKFNLGEYRKNLSLRSRGQAVTDPEVQGMAPELAGQVMRDLKGSDFLELLLGGAQPNETGQKKRPMTPQEEADQYLQKR